MIVFVAGRKDRHAEQRMQDPQSCEGRGSHCHPRLERGTEAGIAHYILPLNRLLHALVFLVPQAKEEFQRVMIKLTEERQQHEGAIEEYKQVRCQQIHLNVHTHMHHEWACIKA